MWRGSLLIPPPQRAKIPQKRLAENSRRHIPNAVDISERPGIVNKRTRFGDFEIDTIVGGSHSQHILTITERCTGLLMTRKLDKPTAAETEKEMIDALSVLAKEGQVRTITSDNGLRFANHRAISGAWGADFYFAKPYHSWERGTNENTNGLISRYGCSSYASSYAFVLRSKTATAIIARI
ncbi:MAG: IS30 family transposase [Bacteroidales bacterium]|nr:IS30 family transposase [Bacteroidales bacterium]